jgi:hypothetical protein
MTKIVVFDGDCKGVHYAKETKRWAVLDYNKDEFSSDAIVGGIILRFLRCSSLFLS